MLNIISFRYLRYISSNRINYIFHTDSKPIIIPRKKIILDSIEEFEIDDFFNIYSHNDYLLDYNISDDRIEIILNNISYSFNYEIRKPKIVEVVVYRNIENNKPQTNTDNILVNNEVRDFTDNEIEIVEPTKPVNQATGTFTLNRSFLSYPVDTDIETIISGIYSSFSSSVAVDIDYSELNPAVTGSYQIYLKHEGKDEILIINIT